MAKYRVTSPDGQAYMVTAPDDAPQDEVMRMFHSHTSGSRQQAGPDLAKVDRNLARLFEQNAPNEDVESYLAHEGVTADQMAQFKSGRRDMKQLAAASMGGGVPGQIMDAIKGKQDPRYAGTHSFYGQMAQEKNQPVLDASARSSIYGQGDAAHGDVMASALGDRFIRRERDANGYDVIVFRGADGGEQKGYVNRPGLDMEDVSRFVTSSTPYLAAGGATGAITKGLGGSFARYVTKPVAQGVVAGSTSIAGDIAAAGEGSKQGVDLAKAGLTAGFGGGAEVASPAASSLARWWRGPRPHLDDAGGLTSEAAAKAKAAGLDPSSLDPEAAEQFARGLNVGADPNEIASMIRTNRFGIPTTKATRTKDPELSAIEKDIRAGNLGQDAKRVMSEFDQSQRQALQGSALSRPNYDDQTMLRRAGNKPGDPYKEGMGAMVAPTRTAVTPDDVAPGTLARSIQDNLKATRDRGDEAISEAFGPVTAVTPKPAAFQSLAQSLRSELGDIRVTDGQHPAATSMVQKLEAYASGKALVGNKADGFLKQTPITTIVEMQRSLLADVKAAAPGSADAAAARAIYRGANNWIDDIADQGLVNGDPAAAAALRTARQVTAEVKSRFDPKGRDIHPAAGRILKEIVDRDNNADSIISKLFSSPTSPPKDGAIDALRSIRRALFEPLKSTGKALADPMEGARTWNDLRMAYWSRLVVNTKGEIASPIVAANNISAAMRNHQGLLGALFEPKEINVMQQYLAALKEASFKDPNPSGTATALRGLMRNESGGWVKSILEAQSQRELFSKHNVFMSRLYRILAKKVPIDILGTRGAAGAKAAQRAVDQNFTPRPPASLGPFGAASSTEWREDQ